MSNAPIRRPIWIRHDPSSARAVRIVVVTALIIASITGIGGCSSGEDQNHNREFASPPGTASPPELSFFKAGNQDKQRIIFVHGTPGSASAWTEYLNDNPTLFEYVAVDRPGFGQSSPDKAMVSLEDQAEALETLLVARDGRWPILIGHSLGAPIIAKLAVLHPNKVGGLIFVSGSFDPDLEKIFIVQRLGEMWPINRMLPSSIRNSNRELFALKNELNLLEKQLPQIEHPITIIHGTRDRLVPFGNVQYLLTHLAKTEALDVVKLDEGNHFLPWNSKGIIEEAMKKMAPSNTIVESPKQTF